MFSYAAGLLPPLYRVATTNDEGFIAPVKIDCYNFHKIMVGGTGHASRICLFAASLRTHPTLNYALIYNERHIMQHKPAPDGGLDAASGIKTRIGLLLFAIYGLTYVGFVLINTFDPQVMGQIVLAGLNLAVVYGFGLIILAIVMGLIYNVICSRAEDRLNPPKEE